MSLRSEEIGKNLIGEIDGADFFSRKKNSDKRLYDRVYLPLGIDVNGVRCLVVGGGRVALRKVRTLIDGGAIVCVASDDFVPELEILASEGRIEPVKSKYFKAMISDNDIIIAATSDKKLNIEIGRDAQESGKLSCVASSAKDSNLIFPAKLSHNGITVAVHSDGKNCLKSKYTKNRIADFLNGKDKANLQLIGIDYTDLPARIQKKLDEFTKKFSEKFYADEIALISTCQRWECYVYDDAPNRIISDLMRFMEKQTDIQWSHLAAAIYTKSQAAALCHLIRLCAGLDSRLIGETDIISQINSAVRHNLCEDSALKSIFEHGLNTAKKIRNQSGISSHNITWTNAVMSFLNKNHPQDNQPEITILGNSRFAERIYRDIGNEYAKVHYENNLDNSRILITCRQMSLNEVDFLISCGKERVVLDLTGQNNCFEPNPHIEYFPLNALADSEIAADMAVSKVKAENLAFEQSLMWYSSIADYNMPGEPIRIGARASRLSIKQVDEVLSLLMALQTDINVSIKKFGSPGDRDKITALTDVNDGDFFTRDLDEGLLRYEIDLAVHSAKDLPQKLHQSLCVAAVTPSAAQWDCLVSGNNINLCNLPAGAKIGTSSRRRAKQILSLKPDVVISDIRGDVQQRLEQLDEGKYDAIVVAAIALIRLGLENRITEIFPLSVFPVEKGQGSLALVTRKSDTMLNEFLKPLDLATREEILSE